MTDPFLKPSAEKPPADLGDLLEDVLHQAKSLVSAELSLARRELVADFKSTAASLVWVVVGAMFLQATLVTLGVLLIMALGVGLGAAAVVAGLLAIGVAAVLYGQRSLEQRKLARTAARLSVDTKQVLESVK